jgi:hypothetical protein
LNVPLVFWRPPGLPGLIDLPLGVFPSLSGNPIAKQNGKECMRKKSFELICHFQNDE